MLKRISTVLLILVLLIIGTVDARTKRKKRYNCSEKVKNTILYYQKKRYNKVKTILNEVKINCSAHSIMDTALYYLGKSFLNTKQSAEARMEFEVLIQDFPKSPFYEEVHFLLGVCCYKESSIYERDQTETKDAIKELNEFINQFPESPLVDSAQHYLMKCRDKLAKKEIMSARFYEKIDQFDAAIVYYKIIIEEFPQSKFIPESRLALARNLIKVNRLTEATEILNVLLSLDTDIEIKKKAQLFRNRIKHLDNIILPKPRQDSTSIDNN